MTTSNASTFSSSSLSLKEYASRACKRIHIGTAVLPQPLQDEAMYATVLQREFNAIVVEHDLKWSPLLGESYKEKDVLNNNVSCLGQYDFTQADIVVNWALQHNMYIKGHVLIWHVTSPKCLEQLTAEQLRMHMKRHIFTVMNYFRGRITTWDVVNEALAPNGTLAKNIFYQKLGPSYIEDAFHYAHQANPDAILLYNDNKVETIGTPKADAFYTLLANMKAKHVPIHGCGMQGHFNAAGMGRNRPPTPRQLKQQIHRLGELGLTVNLSEIDVRTSQLQDPVLETKAQRQIYHDLMVAALSEPACDGIWLWGFTDKHTWVTHFYYDDQPLIFDEQYQKKPSYYALQEAIASFGVGGVVGNGVLLHDDVDVHGNVWGHDWIRPKEDDDDDYNAEKNTVCVEDPQDNDARPDWEQQQEEKYVPTVFTSSSSSLPVEPTDLLDVPNDVDVGDNEHSFV